MLNNRLLKLFIVLIIFFFVNGNALAFYKPKIVVTEFHHPKNWNKPFSPGKIIAHQLENELIKESQFHIIPFEEIQNLGKPKFLDPKIIGKPLSKMPNASKMSQGLKKMRKMENQSSINIFMSEPEFRLAKNSQYQRAMDIDPAIYFYGDDSRFNLIQTQNSKSEIIEEQDSLPDKSIDISNDPILWPANMAKVSLKASFYKVTGQIVKFDPGNLDTSMNNSEKIDALGSKNAELEVIIKLVQNKTGRVIKEKYLKASSNLGKRPFSEDITLGSTKEINEKPSSMDLAIATLTKKVAAFIKNTISPFPLEGEIISVKNEDVLINIGRQNGVKIGDRFRVFSLGLSLTDPLTEVDLGDAYVKMGVIRIVETMLGFSKAMITTGEEFFPGNMVKSFKKIRNSYNAFSSDFTADDFMEEVPWWEFRKIKSMQ